MKTKAEIVVMSHLSDLQEEITMGYADASKLHHIGFIKFLILKLEGDLKQEIDPDEYWEMYIEFIKK